MANGYMRIPKQIDAEVFLFGNYTVKQSFPVLVLGVFWYVAFLTMSDGIARYIMTGCFLLTSFILGKRMGNLILYEYALLFIKYAFLKKKTYIKITRDKSLESMYFDDAREEKMLTNPKNKPLNVNEFIDDIFLKVNKYFKK